MQRLIVLLLLVVLAACTVTPVSEVSQGWDYASLRLIDSVDSPQPDMDLVAAYLRGNDHELEIRLDLLEHAAQPNYDAYLAIDAAPGGSSELPVAAQPAFAWEYLISIPAGGNFNVAVFDEQTRESHPVGGFGLRVKRDPQLDMFTISFDRRLPGLQRSRNPGMQVFLTPAGSPVVMDQLGPIQLKGSPPAPAPALLAFWNVLPAYTPAQALRRWDGAHSGPQGGRHGLYNLLKSASKTQTPLVLLDLKTPGSLVALDFIGGLEMVQQMAEQDLLILPEIFPFTPADTVSMTDSARRLVVQAQAEIVKNFDLPAEQAVYLPAAFDENTLEAAQSAFPRLGLIFARQPGSAGQTNGDPSQGAALLTPLRSMGSTLVMLPNLEQAALPEQQPSGAVLPLAARTALANAAIQGATAGSSGQIVLIGGSLPESAWGNPQFAQEAFHYLKEHPWIQVLTLQDLLAIKPDQAFEQERATAAREPANQQTYGKLLAELAELPENPASRAAWQAALALEAPISPAPAELAGLRAHYAGQIGALIEASRWAEKPVSRVDCSIDYDYDGQAECILANETIFTLIELEMGGFLSYGFFRTASGELHQFAAPSAQLISGASSPMTWNPQNGMLADPAVIPGAFYDSLSLAHPLPAARPSISQAGLLLTYPVPGRDQEVRKAFTLLNDRLSVEYSSSPPGPLSSQVALVLDPWQRFYPGWTEAYQFANLEPGRVLAQAPGIKVELASDASFILATFLDTLEVMSQPENPNQEQPGGHFLPFPIALMVVNASDSFRVDLILSSPVD